MVGRIKTGAFKYDPHRLVDFPQGFFVAFRATREWLIAERLLAIELDTTIFTPIGIDGHTNT